MAATVRQQVEKLPANQQLSFYELFAHQLTIDVRSVLYSPNGGDKAKVESAKKLNELLHAVTQKVHATRLERSYFLDLDDMTPGLAAADRALRLVERASL